MTFWLFCLSVCEVTKMNIDTHPFDAALKNMRGDGHWHEALVQVGDTLDMAKKMLLQSRVRDFTGADVVAVTQLILQRERILAFHARSQGDINELDV
jgi:uncharacterized protein YvpB